MIRGSKYDYDGTPEEFCEAYDMSIEIMRKYQKIQEIIKDWEDGRFSDDVGCLRVKVVLEDDNSVVDNSSMRSDPGNTEHCSDSGTGKEQQEPRVDFKELKCKILMEVDGGTDDAWLDREYDTYPSEDGKWEVEDGKIDS